MVWKLMLAWMLVDAIFLCLWWMARDRKAIEELDSEQN